MSQFYTKEQIDQQAGVIGRYLKTVSTNLTEYIDTSVLSAEEKLSSLESSKFLGTLLTTDDIPLDKAVAGSCADVDAGVGETVSCWIYDVDSGAFVQATGEVAGETAASIKTKYESNADTNAFTDALKLKLDNISEATDTTDFIAALDGALL